MKKSICISALCVLVAVPAGAGQRYDRKLEQAAMKIVAQNIGDIRGGFSYEQKPRFVIVKDARFPDAAPPPRQGISPSIVAPTASPAS